MEAMREDGTKSISNSSVQSFRDITRCGGAARTGWLIASSIIAAPIARFI